MLLTVTQSKDGQQGRWQEAGSLTTAAWCTGLGSTGSGVTLSGGIWDLAFTCLDCGPFPTTCTMLTWRDRRSCLSVTPFTRSEGSAPSCLHSQSGKPSITPDLLEQWVPCHASPYDSLTLWAAGCPQLCPQACLWKEPMPGRELLFF